MGDLQPLPVYFRQYPGPNQECADLALTFLEGEFRRTAPDSLIEFDQTWSEGEVRQIPPGPLLSLINAAKYYDPDSHSHQKEAVAELGERVNPETFQVFDDIWFCRRSYP
ncbi:hypothetical protein [Nodosilinea sp. P-1105]|uniref:hypothetical protein n=1 Tax=Nodosilinea sp. P-1105 TaxID=2546229 RepID=UPI00146E9D60|nr:hypothetical protein [Nodosilinea sp. P-1105]NMF82077.1 hypothetical protein [Nodosilinea sp. P-1105]